MQVNANGEISSHGSTRSRILGILRRSPLPVSGEAMAGELGLSRVAVWKGIHALSDAGYGIASGPEGYLLERDLADSLEPWEFGAGEARFRHWHQTDSTMNRAREAALAGAEDGLVITAERQSAGRGTGGKPWESVPGGLFFTLVTRPRINPAWCHRQVLAAQCAVAVSVRRLTGLEARTAWPNDILIPEGKIGGILAEALVSGNSVSFQNLGIGINTGNRPSQPGSASIKAGRKELLASFLDAFSARAEDSPSLIAEWNALCPDTGRTVRYLPQGGEKAKSGIFRGPDQAGWAVIEGENGGCTHFPPGTITLLEKGRNS